MVNEEELDKVCLGVGKELKQIEMDDLIYNYVLKPNQKPYGVKGEWNVIVEYKDSKYITEHPQVHFDKQELADFKQDI